MSALWQTAAICSIAIVDAKNSSIRNGRAAPVRPSGQRSLDRRIFWMASHEDLDDCRALQGGRSRHASYECLSVRRQAQTTRSLLR
jgi:hypothetical protein